MTTGMEIRNSSNTITFSTNDIVWSFIAAYVSATNAYGSFNLPAGYEIFSQIKVITHPYQFITPDTNSSKCRASYSGSGVVSYSPEGVGTTVQSLIIVLGR